ncbi:MAG: pilus assembly protein [Bryobacterales bacterium]|nr:pilus assembly protein [Bryobacterales bacterium]
MFVLLIGIIDFSMPIFVRSAFTNAVREGVRFGSTYQVLPGKNHTQSIRQIVVQNSCGFLSAADAPTKVQIKFYSPTTFQEVTSGTKNADGNILEVGIANYNYNWMVPLQWGPTAISYNIRVAERLETLPRSATRPATD